MSDDNRNALAQVPGLVRTLNILALNLTTALNAIEALQNRVKALEDNSPWEYDENGYVVLKDRSQETSGESGESNENGGEQSPE